MAISDFDGRSFWPTVRAFVAAQGIEPISDGEIEGEIWGKVRQALDAAAAPVSDGMTPRELTTLVSSTIATLPLTGRFAFITTSNGFEPVTSGGEPVYARLN